MEIGNQDRVFWGLAILVAVIVIYFLPFFIALWIKPVLLFWGFIVGRRRRSALELPDFSPKKLLSVGSPESTPATVPNLTHSDSKARVTEAVEHEATYLTEMHEKRLAHINERLGDFQGTLDNINTRFEQRQTNHKDNFPGNAYYASLNLLNKKTAKDFLLLMIMIGLFFVDTLIAQQVFTSLGMFVTEIITIGGKKIPLTLILGGFLTVVSAFFLHIVWARHKVRSVSGHTAGLIIGCVVLFTLAALRLISVILPPQSKPVIEIALMLGWLLGVVVFYWMLAEILGEDHSWFDLFVAFATPILVSLVIFFGTVFLFEKLIEVLLKGAVRGCVQLARARTTQKKHNAEEAYQATIRGFYRGLTL